ncbi:MAG: Gfo/Idh/MocA family oxidoreductase [Bifidobacteriaceae bacterium]|jgi:predicted dehydrogenase|nr:Gfo/Idh/MocA family oxidoreductase [Bifidobacteriaceae bacterium]
MSAAGTGLRVAIVGGGMIGAFHCRAARLAGAQVVGVFGRDPGATRALAAKWSVDQAYETLDQALAAGLDVVHVCTPNASHAGYARAALEAGSNVVCEKPLGVAPAEAAGLAELARQAGLVATVPYVYRYHPLVREIRARRLAGQFGPWHLLHGSYLQDWLLSPAVSNWRVDPALGGASRAFADIGSHWCDLVEWVSGERIASLVADVAIALPERAGGGGQTFTAEATAAGTGAASPVPDAVPVTTEDAATMLFRTAGGVPGALTVSQVSAGRKNRLWFELDGADGSAVFDQENPETVWLGGLAECRLLVREPGVGAAETRRLTTTPGGHVQGWGACLEAFVADTYAAVRGSAPEGLPTFDDGARSVALVQAVLDSAQARAWVTVP